MEKNGITECFEEVETKEEYNGYFCRIPEIITIAILGSLCGLKNVSQIHQWASNDRVSEFLSEEFGINHVPCYFCCIGDIHTEFDTKKGKSSELNSFFIMHVWSGRSNLCTGFLMFILKRIGVW